MFRKTTTQETAAGMATIIAAGTEITGNIESKGDIRVDGTLIGNLRTSAKILVGPKGCIQGDVTAQQADVLGTITGTVRVTELLSLQGNCIINGNLFAGQLQVAPTASFNGECHTGAVQGANVVDFQTETKHAAAASSR